MDKKELQRHCMSQMYSERVARGRGSPDWGAYDYCMKQHSGT